MERINEMKKINRATDVKKKQERENECNLKINV